MDRTRDGEEGKWRGLEREDDDDNDGYSNKYTHFSSLGLNCS